MKSQETESRIIRYGMCCRLRPSSVSIKYALLLASFLFAIHMVKSVSAISIASDDENSNEFAMEMDSDNRNLNFNSNPAGEFVLNF